MSQARNARSKPRGQAGIDRRRRLHRAALLGALLGSFGGFVSLLPRVLELDETVGLATLFALRGPVSAPSDLAVVSISRDAAVALGQTRHLDTWPRELHAALLERLSAGNAAAVAFDVIFEKPRDPVSDQRLAEAIKRAGNVVLLERTESDLVPAAGGAEGVLERRVLPLPMFKAGALGSAPFVLPRVPIRVGQFWTFGRAATDMPSLPVVALQAYLLPYYDEFVQLLEMVRPGVAANWPATRAAIEAQRNLESTMAAIRGGFRRDPGLAEAARAMLDTAPAVAPSTTALRVLVDLYSGPSSRYLNYYGPARTLPNVPYDQVVDGNAALEVAGKVLFVGFAEPRQPEQQDDFYSVFSLRTGVNLSGVEVGATAFANLLEQRALLPLSMPLHLLLVLILGVLFGIVLGSQSTHRGASAGAVMACAYFGVVYWQFAEGYLWLPLLVPLAMQLPAALGVAVWWNYRELAEQRERVHTALGYYVPQPLVRRLAEQSVTPGSNRQLLHGTCLFTDAEQYTTVSESLRPEELAALMNEYYRVLFGIVERYGGEISDTAGDSMVAIWASAEPDAQGRAQALRAALAILEGVESFNNTQRGWRLPTRVGLESGELLLGNIGARQRYEYRAIGDIVNTASRIQGLNRLLGTRVLVSAGTLVGVSGTAVRDVGTFLLRGKRQPVQVYEPLQASTARLDEPALALFAEALALFRSGAWVAAREHFAAFVAQHPDDGPGVYYETLASQNEKQPPSAGSHGVVEVEK